MALGPTVVVTLPSGAHTLQIEQLADLDSLVEKSVHEHTQAPYWAYVWPSARALTAFLATVDLKHKRVLDLGAGLGPLAVAAALHGADAWAGDLQPESVEMVTRNAARNGVQVQALILDWSNPPADLGRFDCVLAADIIYEDGFLAAILRFLKRHLAPDGVAYIADPKRTRPSGITGAARLSGMEVESRVLVESERLQQEVVLFELRPRARRLTP